MAKEEKRKSLYLGYFVKYFAIFLIPMFILTFLLYKNVVIKIRQDIETSYTNRLKFNVDYIDDLYQKLNDIAVLMQFDSNITNMLSGSNAEILNGIEQLNRYRVENPVIDDIFVFYKKDDKIYSQDGVTSIKNIRNFDTKLSGWITFRDDISSQGSKVVFFHNNEAKGALTLSFIYDIKTITRNPYDMSVVFILSNSIISDQIKQQHENTGSNIYVNADENRRWLSLESKAIDESIINDITESYREKKEMLSYLSNEGDNFSIVSVSSQVTGIEFVSIVSDYDLMQQFYITRNTIIVIIILLIASGVGVALVFSNNSYQPIKKLYNSVEKMIQKPVNTNEIDFIQEIINDVMTNNSNLRDMVNKHKTYVQKQGLIDIVKRKFHNEEMLKKLAEDSQLNFNGKYFWIMVLANYMTEDIENSNEDLFDVEYYVDHYLESNDVGYAFEMLHVKQIVCVLSVNEKSCNMHDFMIDFSKKLKEDFDAEFKTDLLIGVGKYERNLLQLNKSYNDALAALEFGSETAEAKGVRMVDDIELNSYNLSMYPVKLLSDYLNILKQGNTVLALEALDLLFTQIADNVKSNIFLKLVSFEVVNAITKTVLKMDDIDLEKDIDYIAQFNSIDDLKQRIEKFTCKYCGIMESKEKTNDNILFVSVMNFINENYVDGNMSLSLVADKFGKTNYFISRFIKHRLGCNFIDYLTRLRINKAKRLLIDTDMSLNDIADQLGYNSVQSLIINFKKIQGSNPSPYRKNNKSLNSG